MRSERTQYFEGYEDGWKRCWRYGPRSLLSPEELLLLAIFHRRLSFRIWLGKYLRRLSMRLMRWQYDLLMPPLLVINEKLDKEA